MHLLHGWEDVLKAGRIERGLTQIELGAAIGKDQGTISRMERREQGCTLEQLGRLLGALGWDLYELAQRLDRQAGRDPAEVRRAGEGGEWREDSLRDPRLDALLAKLEPAADLFADLAEALDAVRERRPHGEHRPGP